MMIVAQSLETGERRLLINGGTFARYIPTGHLLYARANSLFAVAFDATRVEVTGLPVPIVNDVLLHFGRGAAQYAISSSGTLVYVPGKDSVSGGLFMTDRGDRVLWKSEPLSAVTVNLSPDGKRVAYQASAADDDVWVYDFERAQKTRITFRGENRNPIWTRDGSRLVFTSDAQSMASNLVIAPIDGSGKIEWMTRSDYQQDAFSASPDGTIAYVQSEPDTGRDIWLLSLANRSAAQPLIRQPFDQTWPMFSPDGDWLAYVSNESGRAEVYVRPTKGEGRWQISVQGGQTPRWSSDGRELYYRDNLKLVFVSITTEPTFSASRPRVLFEIQRWRSGPLGHDFDVTPDGRFVFIKKCDRYVREGLITCRATS